MRLTLSYTEKKNDTEIKIEMSGKTARNIAVGKFCIFSKNLRLCRLR